jgi:hypothetical protein
MKTILVHTDHVTYHARIINQNGNVLGTASSTAGPLFAAQAVVKKFYAAEVVDTIAEIKDPAELRQRGVSDYMKSPRRKQTFPWIYGFKH